MIVIHIFGRSNTGKTTLIEALCRQLAPRGRTETIKHIGHHPITLEEGKDTTIHFRAGASGSTGIDDEKSVTITSHTGLTAALNTSSDRGVEFCIVEGYKSVPLPGVALGDVEGEHILMRDPEIGEILSRLDEFPRWTTPKAIINSLLRDREGGDIGGIILLQDVAGMDLERAASAASTLPEIKAARGELLLSGCSTPPDNRKGCLAVVGRSAISVAYALYQGSKELERDPHQEDFNQGKSEE